MSTVDDVILGRLRIADVPTVGEIRRDPSVTDEATAAAVLAVNPPSQRVRKPRGPSKKLAAQLSDEYARGWSDSAARDRGPDMLGLVFAALAAVAAGVGLGAWLF